MQTLHDIEQIADRLTAKLFDSSIHNKSINVDEAVKELAEEYLDDEEQIFEVLISEEFVDFEAAQSTLRALVCAYKYGRDESLVTFAKSLAQQILDGVDKKAEWMVTK